MAELFDWDATDGNNTDLWPEGMSGGAINNSGRAMQGLLARHYEDHDSSRTSSGSSNAYAVTSSRTIAALFDGLTLVFTPNFTNTGAATLNLNGIGAKDIVRHNGTALTAGDITSAHPVVVVYKQALDDFVMLSMTSMGAASETATGLIELATAAEVEALDSSRAVRASTMHRHPGMPKAGGNLNGTGTPAFRTGDYGMGAVTDNGTGDYTLALDTAFNDTNYWVTGFARDGNGSAVRSGLLTAPDGGTKTASTFQVQMFQPDNNSLLDSSEMGITFWGDYA
jgi:hypothetical protein